MAGGQAARFDDWDNPATETDFLAGAAKAGAVIAMVPCVILYLALQRYYVQGLISGAVKG